MESNNAYCYSENELLPISALQHLMFCERQCALIHVEQLWVENRLTVEGKNLHDKVHDADSECRGDVRIVRGLRLRSFCLGLSGIADVVEFHADIPFPVEYKRGKPKPDICDKVQLCAQALCLAEMTGVAVSEGAIFYGKPRRRLAVNLSEELQASTRDAAVRLHALFDSGKTPSAVYEKKCMNCSLKHLCLPESAGAGKSARRYLGQMLK